MNQWNAFIHLAATDASLACASPYDIEATISFLPTERGGRSKPFFSGFRPQFFYDGHDWAAQQDYPDVPQVNPGETVRAHLRFASPEHHVGKVIVGMTFLVREGPRTIGTGVVTRILDLEESARRALQR